MFDMFFSIWVIPILIMLGIVTVGITIHLLTLPFLFVWAVLHRRGWQFLKDNPVLMLAAIPIIAPLSVGVMFYTVYGIKWVLA